MRLEQLRSDPQEYPFTLLYTELLLRVCERRLEEASENDVLLPSSVHASENFSEH